MISDKSNRILLNISRYTTHALAKEFYWPQLKNKFAEKMFVPKVMQTQQQYNNHDSKSSSKFGLSVSENSKINNNKNMIDE